jgi:hypothetical protein
MARLGAWSAVWTLPAWRLRTHACAQAGWNPREVRSTNDAAMPVHSAARMSWGASVVFFRPTTPTCCPSPTPWAPEPWTTGG